VTIKEHLSKHDREIAAIRKLMVTGMRMLVRNEEQIGKLIAAQRKTDESLKKLLDSLKTGHNGHSKLHGKL
jgi:carbamoylphosphate synthase large subunit